jgi:hypothetical protein
MTVTLREIDDDNRAAAVALDVSDVQHTYVDGVSESLDDARPTRTRRPATRPSTTTTYPSDS